MHYAQGQQAALIKLGFGNVYSLGGALTGALAGGTYGYYTGGPKPGDEIPPEEVARLRKRKAIKSSLLGGAAGYVTGSSVGDLVALKNMGLFGD